MTFFGEEGQGSCVKVIPQKAGSDSEASARALATEQPSRAWLFAERSGSPKGEAVTFGKESRGELQGLAATWYRCS